MIKESIILILSTFFPLFELRLSIPLGILVLGMNPILVALISITTNIIVGIISFLVFRFIVTEFRHIKVVDKIYNHYVIKVQKKIHPKVEKYGPLGLALFIGVPLPLSGVYTGSIGAYVLGFDFKDFLKASVIGILIAATIVFLVSVSFDGFLSYIGYSPEKVELFRTIFRL